MSENITIFGTMFFLFIIAFLMGYIIGDHNAVDRANEYMNANCACDRGSGYNLSYAGLAGIGWQDGVIFNETNNS